MFFFYISLFWLVFWFSSFFFIFYRKTENKNRKTLWRRFNGPEIIFFSRRASYHFKAQECKHLRAFDFFQLLNKNYIIKMQFTIQFFWEKPISWITKKTRIFFNLKKNSGPLKTASECLFCFYFRFSVENKKIKIQVKKGKNKKKKQ